MGSAFKLLTAVLILVNGAKDRDDLFLRRQGDGAGNLRDGTLGGLDDGLGGLVDQLMIVGFETDADRVFLCHDVFLRFVRFFPVPLATPDLCRTDELIHTLNRAYQTLSEKQTGLF